jgi:dTDP-4-dehydrorhamnose 3,5-epimerase-like enzyme
MQFNNTKLEGLFLIKPYHSADVRGTFVKTFNEDEFAAAGLEYDLIVTFY